MDINNFISKRANLVDGSAIRKANEYAANIKNPINLTIGQPDFDVAPQIKEALLTAINNKKNGYCKTAGIDELRSSILSKKGGGEKRCSHNIRGNGSYFFSLNDLFGL